jgi:hypothetical protein
MSIPYRDEQILRILAANPTGLTTGQILAIAKTQRGNELPDSNITSQRIYALRETKTPKIESSDTAAGRVHKITAAGRELIAELDRNNPTAPPIQPADIEQALNTDENHTDPAEPIDVLQQFDQAVAIIREALVAAQAEPVKITDKRAKIDLLEKLENIQLLEPWAVELIGEIRADIGKLESA